MIKPFIKHIIYQLSLAGSADTLHFHYKRLLNGKANRMFRKDAAHNILPPDRFLHETYQLDYRKFIDDGELTAKEIIDWTKPYLPSSPVILDWGCGAGRVIRCIEKYQPGAQLYGCDINEEMIEWNKTHYPGIAFTTINGFTPSLYAPVFFDLVYGISILTHIDASHQSEWLRELHRILKNDGILLLSTQGSFYDHQLLPSEKNHLRTHGMFTRQYAQQGHRMMSTYHSAEYFRQMLTPYFRIIQYTDGSKDPRKLGGQDCWILAKT